MPCEHKALKSVNCVVFCVDCGKVFTPEELQNLNKPKEPHEEPAEKKRATRRKA